MIQYSNLFILLLAVSPFGARKINNPFGDHQVQAFCKAVKARKLNTRNECLLKQERLRKIDVVIKLKLLILYSRYCSAWKKGYAEHVWPSTCMLA